MIDKITKIYGLAALGNQDMVNKTAAMVLNAWVRVGEMHLLGAV